MLVKDPSQVIRVNGLRNQPVSTSGHAAVNVALVVNTELEGT
jgi:hypothetical protein